MKKNNIRLVDIAEKANVSISTVSHVINNTRQVNKDTRDRVNKVLLEFGYKKSLNSSNKLKHLGLIIADITEDYSISLIKAIEKQCKKHNLSVLVCDSEDDIEIERQNIKRLTTTERINGIMISPVNSTIYPDLLANCNCPIVCFDRKFENFNTHFFGINNLETGYNASKYLFKHNCSKIGFIGYPDYIYSVNQRRQGYLLYAQKNFTNHKSYCLEIEYFKKTTNDEIKKFILKNNIDGLICATSSVCHHVIMAIEEIGLKIPNDIKIVTYDNNKWLDFLKYPISVINQPTKEIGKGVVEGLVSLINNPNSIISEQSEIYYDTIFIDRLNK